MNEVDPTIMLNLARIWEDFRARVLQVAPRLLAALVVLALGWLLAALLKFLLRRTLRLLRFDLRCERSGLATALRRADLAWTPTDLVAALAFWVVWLSGAMFALGVLDIPLFNRLETEFFIYLPKALVGLLILGAGILVANFLARAALLLAVEEELPSPRLIAAGVRLLVNVLALAMALEQLGIAQNTVMVAFAITFGAIMLATALAFGLGGRGLAAEFLSRKARDQERQGDGRQNL
jgi:small-conductance mechanosensitive channel